MPFSMKFYQDQLVAEGGLEAPLPAAARMIFVRHGAVVMNGRRLQAQDSAYFSEPLAMQADCALHGSSPLWSLLPVMNGCFVSTALPVWRGASRRATATTAPGSAVCTRARLMCRMHRM